MKVRYLPALDMDVKLLEDTMVYLLSGFTAAPGQRLISNDKLVKVEPDVCRLGNHHLQLQTVHHLR